MVGKLKRKGRFILFTFLLIAGCSLGNPVEQMAQRIKQTYIVSYELEWLVSGRQKQRYVLINKGNQTQVKEAIKQAMDSLVPYTKSGWNYIWLKPLGILRLNTSEGRQERIDITKACFFAGDTRIETAAFYSKELAAVIKKMFNQAQDRYELLTTATLFVDLSKPGALEYLAEPKVRNRVLKGIKENLQTQSH